MKRVIALLMENQPGALSRVVGLFSQRGYNIETLVVAPTSDPTLSRLTMSTEGDEKVVEQITKQLDKLIDVVLVTNLSDSEFVERELMLIKFDKDSFPKEAFEEKVLELRNTPFPKKAEEVKKLKAYKAMPLQEGIDYYMENGNMVFKEWFHLKRGNCCGNGCRHCPY